MKGIYVFFGLIASGKSYLAEAFADRHSLPYHNTDRVRKELAGVDPTTSCADSVGKGIYTKEFSLKTYGAMLELAEDDLDRDAGAVVLDGSYHSRLERGRVQEFAAVRGIPLVFIFCSCPEQEVRRRLDLRARDPEAVSDANWEIYVAQKSKFERPDELSPEQLIEIDTNDKLEVLLTSLENEIVECRTSNKEC